MPPALEGVGRERDSTPDFARKQAGKRDVQSGLIDLCHGSYEPSIGLGRFTIVWRTLQGREYDRRFHRIRPGVADFPSHRGVVTDSHHNIDAEFGQGLHVAGEQGGCLILSKPVVDIESVNRLHDPAGHAAHEWEGRHSKRDAVERRLQALTRGLRVRLRPSLFQLSKTGSYAQTCFQIEHPGNLCRCNSS